MMEPSLYSIIGGEAAIEALVLRFYRKVMTDPLLQPFFADTDMDHQVEKQKAFLSYVLGCPDAATRNSPPRAAKEKTAPQEISLRQAHAHLVKRGLDDRHFNAVARHLRITLEEMGTPPSATGRIMAIIESSRDEVLGR
ncbi:MAG TPA: group 1 truncated hemoglobin [Moraxellaceae bacterium]